MSASTLFKISDVVNLRPKSCSWLCRSVITSRFHSPDHLRPLFPVAATVLRLVVCSFQLDREIIDVQVASETALLEERAIFLGKDVMPRRTGDAGARGVGDLHCVGRRALAE
jgi:hypothetical protein